MERSNQAKKPTVTVENLLGCAGFQVVLFICLQMCCFLMSTNWLFMALAKMEPQWTCHDDLVELGIRPISMNMTNESMKCAVINQRGKIFCLIILTIAQLQTCEKVCIKPHYKDDFQWQLVCNRDHYVYLIITLQMVGGFIGSPLFGQLSDSYGRRWTVLVSTVLTLTSGASGAFAPNWQVFALLRFILGFSCGGVIVTGYVYIVEFLTKKHRLWFFNVGGWNPCLMIFYAIGYAIGEWRMLSIVPNIVGIPILILVWWIGESPRWLIQKGRFEEAEKQLRRINKINGNTLDDEELKIVLQRGKVTVLDEEIPLPTVALVGTPTAQLKKTKQYSYWHLFSTRTLAVHTLALTMGYCAVAIVAGGISFGADKLGGNIYLNLIIIYLIRWIANVLVVLADIFIKSFGRRVGLIVPFIGTSVCSAVIAMAYCIWNPKGHAIQILVIVLTNVMAALNPSIWTMLMMSNVELFPTPIRNLANGWLACLNRVGSVIVPYILYLAHVWRPAPFAVYSVMSLIAGILIMMFIPETKGKPLPETMPEQTIFFDCFSSKSRRRASVINKNKDEVNGLIL